MTGSKPAPNPADAACLSELLEGAMSRDLEGRLFLPVEFANGWSISMQADKAGYACAPRKRLPSLQDYESVEVIVHAPGSRPADPERLELSPDLLAKFNKTYEGGPFLGHYLNWSDIEELAEAVSAADEKTLEEEGIYILSGTGPHGHWMEPFKTRSAALEKISEVLEIDGFSGNGSKVDRDSFEFWSNAAHLSAEKDVNILFRRLDPATLEPQDAWGLPDGPAFAPEPYEAEAFAGPE